MIETKTCVNVWIDSNMDSSIWVDFCFVFGAYEDVAKAEEIIQEAYNDWWELEEAQCEPIVDYIGSYLTENDIDFEVYFKEVDNP